ncbi:hypothetical protein F5Y18DRAFT_109022 [Xylariaceae sp. FL1019]|nr:hypothetical protein F5Y18DRAFT_109022 [Xylariaceae sp. FL1019]
MSLPMINRNTAFGHRAAHSCTRLHDVWQQPSDMPKMIGHKGEKAPSMLPSTLPASVYWRTSTCVWSLSGGTASENGKSDHLFERGEWSPLYKLTSVSRLRSVPTWQRTRVCALVNDILPSLNVCLLAAIWTEVRRIIFPLVDDSDRGLYQAPQQSHIHRNQIQHLAFAGHNLADGTPRVVSRQCILEMHYSRSTKRAAYTSFRWSNAAYETEPQQT